MARSLFWEAIRWRAPITDGEAADCERALDALDSAWAMDRTLDYPWAEWAELLAAVGRDPPSPEVLERGRAAGPPTIGYRRHPVTTMVGPWTLTLDGSFSEEWNGEGTTLSGCDGERTVWFTPYSVGGDPPPSAEKILDRERKVEGTPVTRSEGALRSLACLRRERGEDGEYWLLHGRLRAW